MRGKHLNMQEKCFQNESAKRITLDKQKLRELTTRIPILHEILTSPLCQREVIPKRNIYLQEGMKNARNDK